MKHSLQNKILTILDPTEPTDCQNKHLPSSSTERQTGLECD